MGTNYYWHEDYCDCCDRPKGEELHIGKSSARWCFSLRRHKHEGINDLPDWVKKFEQGVIIDEYGDRHSPEQMIEIIVDRGVADTEEDYWESLWKNSYFYHSEEDFHRSNYSQRGPNGLLRHKVCGMLCVKQGEGTWDIMEGEFS